MFRSIIAIIILILPFSIMAQVNTATSLNEREPDNMKNDHKEEEVIYLFSGLGADYRAFQNLRLPGYRLVYVNWIPPEKSESMAHYAGRIKSQITTPNPIVIGLSFGGMIAVELAKQMAFKKIILISSAKTKQDLAGGNCIKLFPVLSSGNLIL